MYKNRANKSRRFTDVNNQIRLVTFLLLGAGHILTYYLLSYGYP